MTTRHPLTHHEILGLVEPFARGGRRIDLAASDRIARRLVFEPVDHACDAPASACLRETVQLENPDPDTFVLSRFVSAEGGLQAMLQATGAQPAELLECVSAVDPRAQFRTGPGFVVALNHRLAPGASEASGMRMLLLRGEVRVDGLSLALRMPAVPGFPAELELAATAAAGIELPDDLLEVLGRDWSRLASHAGGWRSTVLVRGKEPDRSRRAERRLEEVALHLARTLAEPPGRFHARLAVQRWQVALRNAVPLLSVLGLIGAALAVPSLAISDDSVLRMLIQTAPPLLLAFGVCRREMPRIEWPRWPRAPRASSWRPAHAADAMPHDMRAE